jgi:hypothetical protein
VIGRIVVGSDPQASGSALSGAVQPELRLMELTKAPWCIEPADENAPLKDGDSPAKRRSDPSLRWCLKPRPFAESPLTDQEIAAIIVAETPARGLQRRPLPTGSAHQSRRH